MARLKLTIAYVGTDFHGWQTQARKDKVVPTIQSVLEARMERICGQPVHVHGSGRTDAGVHAEAQVAHVDVPDTKARLDWQMALNTSLPPSIRIVEAALAPDDFHAQRHAIRKVYEYRLWLSQRYTPPWLHPFVWACGPLDVARMDEAARLLVGRHDFASLRNAGTDVLSTVRTIVSISRRPSGPLPPAVAEGRAVLTWRFEADGFLKQMVRNSMGLLVAVGRGKLDAAEIPAILAAGDRRRAPATAPAHGLTLKKVWYSDDAHASETAAPTATPPARDAAVPARLPVLRWNRGGWERTADAVSPETRVAVHWPGGADELWAWPEDLPTLRLGHALLEQKRAERALFIDDQRQSSPRNEPLSSDPAPNLTPEPTAEPVWPDPERLLAHMAAFLSLPGRIPRLWEATGSFHRAAVLDGAELLHLAEDISRHNCIDRLAGWAWQAGVDPTRCVLLLSARITGSLYERARLAGFRFLVSRATVTAAATDRAEQDGATLIGFCRPHEQRFTVFADPTGRMRT